MKKIICAALSAATILTANAQKTVPVIKPGTTIKYQFTLHEQSASFDIKIKHIEDTLSFNWSIKGLASGTYSITPEALKNANKLNFAQPVANKDVVLPDDQTFLMISQAAFNDLLQKHAFVYDSTQYDLKDDADQNPILFKGQQLNVLHVVAKDETTQFWILNSAAFPLICQIKGNPLGIDVTLNDISQQ